MSEMLSVAEAAATVGLSARRIHDFIKDGRLPAEKIGAYYVIKKADLKLIEERTNGRPKKEKK